MDKTKLNKGSENTNPTVDITKFEEGPKEIIKYMDYMPDDDTKRMELLMSFMTKCVL